MSKPRKFAEKLDQLQSVSTELNQMLADGSFYRLSFANRSAWIRRVKKLYSSLRGPIAEFSLKPLLAAAAVSSAALLAAGCPAPDGGGGTGVTAFAAPVTNAFGLTDVGYDAAPSFADIDNDGDLDALIGAQNGNTYYFENTGTASAPVFAAAVINPFGLASVSVRAVPSFVDIDDDGILEAYIGADNGSTYYFENTGTAAAPAFAAAVTNPFGLTMVNQAAAPRFIDIDNDGTLDAFIGDGNGDISYFHNTGAASAPAFAAAAVNPFGIVLPFGSFNRPGFADIDTDGDLDLFIGLNDINTYYFQNTGTVSAPAFAAPVSNPFGLVTVATTFRTSPCFVDIDDDGDLDAFIGYNDGNTYYFRNTEH